MAGINATLNERGLRELLQYVQNIDALTENWQPYSSSLLSAMQADVDTTFDRAPGVETTGQVPNGETWPRVTEEYLRQRPERRGGQQLRDTGELLQSFQVGARGNVSQVTNALIRFGSDLPKARGLQEKRVMINLNAALLQTLVNIVGESIIQGGQLGINFPTI